MSVFYHFRVHAAANTGRGVRTCLYMPDNGDRELSTQYIDGYTVWAMVTSEWCRFSVGSLSPQFRTDYRVLLHNSRPVLNIILFGFHLFGDSSYRHVIY